MKIVFSEYNANYKTYTFSYGVYTVMESLKDLEKIYEAGFLPYSGSSEIKNHFYFCRSLRVDLSKFTKNSENRRIEKKHPEKLIKKVHKNVDKLSEGEYKEIFNFYLNYFKNIHGENIMSKPRLEFVLNAEFVNRLVTYRNEQGELVGSIIMVESGGHLNFWFSSYALEKKNSGFGLWMMLDEIEDAQRRELKYFYLGTCYGLKAKYKLNFNGLEFFDGVKWNGDMKELKDRIKGDGETKDFDLVKDKKPLF